MARNIQLRELLIGVEGLALLRHLFDGTDVAAQQRLAEVRRILDDESLSMTEPMTEADPQTGYRCWSESYDDPGNFIIGLEQPATRTLFGVFSWGRHDTGLAP